MPPSDATLPPQKPRGFYTDTSYKAWSKDTTTEYFQGTAIRLYWPLAKSAAALVLFSAVYVASGNWQLALGILVAATLSYQRIVAFIVPNTISMPAMDQITFLSNPKANIHYMSNAHFDQPGVGVEDLRLEELSRMHPKMRYKIKEIMGDYYYEEMSVEEALEKAILKPDPEKLLRNQDDIDQFVRDNMNKKLPLDGPLWRGYFQDYPDSDALEPHLQDLKVKSTVAFKLHHCLCDGVSVTSFVLSMSQEYDSSYFLPMKNIPFWYRLLTRLGFLFYIPKMILMTVFSQQDYNFLTKKKLEAPLTGEINTHSSTGIIPLDELKASCKKMKITINDMILCGLTTALHTMAREREDLSETCQIVIPANLRFKAYPTREAVKLENKFTGLPLTVPLTSSMESAYKPIMKITKQIKSSMGLVYAMYASSFWTSQVLPRAAILKGIEEASRKMTIGFSNTPGPLKNYRYKNPRTGMVSHSVTSHSYVMVAGQLGIILGAISSPGQIKLTLQSDSQLLSSVENKGLLNLVYNNVMTEIKRIEQLEEAKKEK